VAGLQNFLRRVGSKTTPSLAFSLNGFYFSLGLEIILFVARAKFFEGGLDFEIVINISFSVLLYCTNGSLMVRWSLLCSIILNTYGTVGRPRGPTVHLKILYVQRVGYVWPSDQYRVTVTGSLPKT
jgi:hypothetical protein